MYIWMKRKKAAAKWLYGVAGALLCMVLAGCGGSTRTIPIQMGESPGSGVRTGTASAGADTPVTLPGDTPRAEDERQDEKDVIYVHVCGAVNEPGVVLLPEGSRGQDALEAAGGFAPGAAVDAVNLAEPLTDGVKLYFPTLEEAEDWQESEQARESGLVNINTADVAQLCTLPGIGEARAKAIIAYRETNGNFKDIEDIMKVSGIKDSAFGKIRDRITVK